ncbi:class I SAM-dependent methyltransferase [bacterium]|nr:class I SAM-dependent methyltransferase [bacterium]
MTESFIKQRTDSLDSYGEYEYHLTRATLLPLFHDWGLILKDKYLIDIGCGAGGSSQVLYEEGAHVTGLDIDADRIDTARDRTRRNNQPIEFLVSDVHEPPPRLMGRFDLAIVRDVLEHVADPHLFLDRIRSLIKQDGLIFVSFPPYYSAFGGHQHHPRSITRFIPWCHLIPQKFYVKLLPEIESYRQEVKSLNKLTIGRMEALIAANNFRLVREELFYIRPSLHYKYGLPVIRAGRLARRGSMREFLITGAFFLLASRT